MSDYFARRTIHSQDSFAKPYRLMSREERLQWYDRHNGDSRHSDDPNLRNHGLCGCSDCAKTRRDWQDVPIPINDYGAERARGMASINLCERCGSFVLGNALGGLSLRTSAEDDSEAIKRELCPDCVGDLVTVIEAEKDQATKPYRKGWKREVEKESKSVAQTLADTPLKDVVREIMREAMDEQRAIEGGQSTVAE